MNETSKPRKPALRHVPMSAVDQRLSPFGRIAVHAQMSMGLAPRYEEGMSLEDAALLTGLPRAEACRRIEECSKAEDPKQYAASRLSQGAGERFKTEPKIVQLPIWAEPVRGTPNSFLRGALFAAIHGKEREYLKGQLLASRDGISIRFTGMQLDQSDLDVWEQAIEIARLHPLGNICRLTIYGFLKALGRSMGKSDHEWLKDVLRRLAATCVEITHGKYSYGGSLLEFYLDEEAGFYVLKINSKIIEMYKAGWTGIDWGTRQKLRRKPLALWIHGYLSSDAKNYPTKVETIHRLSGSKTKELRFFKANLKAALADLEKATDGRMGGTITESGLVEWKSEPTASQARHLAKKTGTAGGRNRRNRPTPLAELLPGKPK